MRLTKLTKIMFVRETCWYCNDLPKDIDLYNLIFPFNCFKKAKNKILRCSNFNHYKETNKETKLTKISITALLREAEKKGEERGYRIAKRIFKPKVTEVKKMKDLTISRGDFRNSQDHPHESLFEWILSQLGIKEEKWDDIDEVTITDIMTDNIEVS